MIKISSHFVCIFLCFIISNLNECNGELCPGMYCGQTRLQNGSYTSCGACERGYRPDAVSKCIKCDLNPSFYDWMYLGFMALLSLALHWFFIDFTNKKKCVSLIILHVSAFAESVGAAILTLLVSEPIGSLNLTSCSVRALSDWYTMWYNPSPDYVTTLHCTQEAVYPLYSIVMVYYAFSLVLMMMVRPILSSKVTDGRGTKAIYAALYFFPILTVVQAVFGGLLYYSFPYILFVVSITTLSIHFSTFDQQTVKYLMKENFVNPRNLVILLYHWLLHAYGIIAITQLQNMAVYLSLLIFVPIPTFFYILTVKFTHPYHLEHV